jgi:Na+/H+ antiporter NhaD/arsenite permease-like protein
LALMIALVTVCIFDIQLLKKVDYLLLLTFICFFIFVGNLSHLEFVNTFARDSLTNPASVFFSSIFLSQIISNVPAAILLSKFSLTWQPLLLGVNIGGLGTIIASLASVISYKLFIKKYPKESKRYLIKFSLYNFSFLAFLPLFNIFSLLFFLSFKMAVLNLSVDFRSRRSPPLQSTELQNQQWPLTQPLKQKGPVPYSSESRTGPFFDCL